MSAPESFDPYHTWLGIPPEEQPGNHYRLLGVRLFEDKPEVIEHAADQRMAHLRALQTGKYGALSQHILNEVAAARICLLHRDKKAAYDAALREKLAAAGPPAPPPEEPDEQFDGTVFDHYLLLDLLASTRSGPIFKARHRPMNRLVAMKILSAGVTGQVDVVERFYRKIRVLAQMEHPNLVTAYDAGQRDGTHYLVMEYVDGQDLATMIKQYGPLPIEHAVNYTMRAASALGHVHAHRVMAPEQALSSAAADHLSDIYSLGCTLHALLTGRPPYSAKSRAEQTAAHLRAPIPSLCRRRPEVPPELDAVFRQMMAKHREERPQSMAEVITALQAC